MARRGILLTGATGFLGRYLLRELLASGRPVAVLARSEGGASAEERVRQVLEFASAGSSRRLPAPEVLAGDLREPGLGLSAADRDRLARNYGSVVHAAASLSFRRTADGEPHRTNLLGTYRLLEVCAACGLREFHHVSTAFVCGDRAGPVLEADADCGQEFHNAYERSKLTAELAAREAAGVRATVYRPSVIVGDSRTGHTTSYHGFYRFLELANRLAQPGEGDRRRLPLRLPFGGSEPRDLVPVDWVAAAVARIVGNPALHGHTYHLTAARPTPVAEIKHVAIEELGLQGVELAGTVPHPSPLERLFLDGLRDYWPYLGGDPVFDRRNTLAALPDLPPPLIDRDCLRRLVKFAVADRWGAPHRNAARGAALDCGDYIERFFPDALPRSPVSRLGIDATLGFDIRGPGGGRWLCRLAGGRVLNVARDAAQRAEVEYRMAVPTFAAVVSGRESPQSAFIGRRIEIVGSVEKGLKLAVLFGQFVRDFPYPASSAAAEVRK